jgi:hypothetical protein
MSNPAPLPCPCPCPCPMDRQSSSMSRSRSRSRRTQIASWKLATTITHLCSSKHPCLRSGTSTRQRAADLIAPPVASWKLATTNPAPLRQQASMLAARRPLCSSKHPCLRPIFRLVVASIPACVLPPVFAGLLGFLWDFPQPRPHTETDSQCHGIENRAGRARRRPRALATEVRDGANHGGGAV